MNFKKCDNSSNTIQSNGRAAIDIITLIYKKVDTAYDTCLPNLIYKTGLVGKARHFKIDVRWLL